jgi:hypothetical protein
VIKHIIDLLQIDEFYEASENVQIAGLYSYETGLKAIYKQKKREQMLKKLKAQDNG